MLKTLPTLIAALLFASPVFAGQWVVDYSRSHLGFSGTQGEEPFSGEFHGFTADITFDPATLKDTRIDITIPIAKVSVAGSDRQDAILEADWFDVKNHPTAHFTSSEVVPDTKGGFIARGTLTIKGISQPLDLPFTLLTNNGETTMNGTTSVKRNAFKLGLGDFKTDEWVGFDVRIDAMLVATPKKP